LADQDAWWRETAQRLLFERQDRSVVPVLKVMVSERPSALGRLHSLWTLELLSSLDAASIKLGLDDSEPRVREAVIRLAERRLGREAALFERALTLANDPDPMVRFQLAFSLGEANRDSQAMAALGSIARKDAMNQWTRTAILSSIGDRPLLLFEAISKQDGFIATPSAQALLDELAFLIGCRRKTDDAGLFMDGLRHARLSSDAMTRVLLALCRGQVRRGGSTDSLFNDPALAEAKKLLNDAAALAVSEGPIERRLAAIGLLALGDRNAGRRIFPSLLDAREPTSVQLSVLQASVEILDGSVAREVVHRWKAMSPSVRREAVEVLFSRAEGIDALLSGVESRSLTSSEIDPARLQQLQKHANPGFRHRAQKIIDSEGAASRDRLQVIAIYRPALQMAGDRDRGREVFQKTCATCHQAEGRGVDVGPNLATVTNRSDEELLVHILDPNREVAPNFVSYNVATAQGRVISGIISDESGRAIVVRRAEGATDVIPRERIEAVSSSGVSLMPEGLERELSVKDFADLIAFVHSIRAAAN
jgi:putative heme-binding domain-containing protein